MAAALLPNAEQVFIDANGVPLVGGSVYFYIPETLTLKDTWQDAGQDVLNSNPVILGSRGEAVIWGNGTYRQIVKNSDGDTIWDEITDNYSVINAGFEGFVYNDFTMPTTPVTGLTVVLPEITAIFNNVSVTYPSVTATVVDETITDYWGNDSGEYIIEDEPLNNYPALPRYPDLLHVWKFQANGGNITAIYMMGNITPIVNDPSDVARVIDQFTDLFALDTNTIAWSAGLPVVYRDLLVTTAGNVYQVYLPGTTGGAAPTSTAEGIIIDGTAQLFYYCQSSYCGNFRYAINNGVNNYFSNLAAKNICAMVTQGGVQMHTVVKEYLLSQFKHIINNWQASSAYLLGQKMIADDFIWLCTTAGTTAATDVAFTSSAPHTVGQVVTDGTSVWKGIYARYGTQSWFWMDCDRTFLTYRYPDSHDSYASTFLDLIWWYLTISRDMAWITTASTQPGYTYLQVIQNVYDFNLSTQILNFLTNTFQDEIAPWDGSSYTIQYLEDNCESYSGFRACVEMFDYFGDAARSADAAAGQASLASGIYNLNSTTYNIFATNYGQDVSLFANNPNVSYYPYIQAQYFPELHQVESINDSQKQQVRAWVYDKWNTFIADRGKDTTAQCFLGYVAARFWNDPVKAQAIVDIAQKFFLTNNSINITDFSFYLLTKDLLVSPNPIIYTDDYRIFVQERAAQKKVQISTVNQFRSSNTAGGTVLGAVVRKLEVFDQNGVSLGFMPIYDTIT